MTTELPELQEMPPIDTAPKAEPKRRGRPPGRKDSAPRATPSTPRKSPTPNLQKRIAGSLTTLGTVGCLFHEGDGLLVVQHAESVSKALAKVADENPAVRANLERMLAAGTWSALFAAMLPLLIGIAINHGLLPKHLASLFAGANGADEQSAPANDASGTGA